MKTLIKLLQRIFKVRIIKNCPHGFEFLQDVKRSLPAFRALTIFDVGANVGQTTKIFIDGYPEAKIHCFEPVSATYTGLRSEYGGNSRVFCWNLAMGAIQAIVPISIQKDSSLSRVALLSSNKTTSNEHVIDKCIEKVRMTTVSKFCQEMNINKIEILKIDTEGYDLEVLKGADDLLQSQSIDLVQTEVGISSTNNYHVPFQIINQFLIERNYYVFGIYNQELEWPTSEPRLRRVDVVYISENALRSNMSLDN